MYNTRIGTAFAGAWTFLLVGAIFFFGQADSDTMFVHWGPSNNTVFGGMRVDSWPRWAFVMSYSVLSQVVYSVVSNTLSPYVSNVIRDHKTPREDKGGYTRGQLLVQLYTAYHWLSSIFDVFLWITLQLQYLAPAILTDLVLTWFLTRSYFSHNPLAAPLNRAGPSDASPTGSP